MCQETKSDKQQDRFRLTRTGMTRPDMIAHAISCYTGETGLPDGVELVELIESGDTVDAGYGDLISFVLSDDPDYLGESLPDGLLSSGANYIMHAGMYAHIAGI
jgi:hypothetical protein